jgi:hypothetical protein
VNGTNYKIIYDVSPNSTDTQHLTVVINVPPTKDTNEVYTILSATLPNGQRQISAGSHSVSPTNEGNCNSGMVGALSCWKNLTDADTDMKNKFIGYQAAIEKFHGSKNYGSEFVPIRYKSQVVNGTIYMIQYKTSVGTV